MKKILQAFVVVLVILGVMGVVGAGVYAASQNSAVQSLITAGRGAGGPPNGMMMDTASASATSGTSATGAITSAQQTRPQPPNGMGGDHDQGGINAQSLQSLAKNLGQFAVITVAIVLLEKLFNRVFKRKNVKKPA